MIRVLCYLAQTDPEPVAVLETEWMPTPYLPIELHAGDQHLGTYRIEHLFGGAAYRDSHETGPFELKLVRALVSKIVG